MYNYQGVGEINIDDLKIHTKILLFPSYFKDQGHINLYPELLPGYFQMLDYYSKIQLRKIYNKFTSTLSKNINGEDEVLREETIKNLTMKGIIQEVDGRKKIEWSTLISEFQNTQEYINWAATGDSSFMEAIQTENNTNLEYLETKIYTKYITGYKIIKKTLESFKYYKNNIDNICILFDDYQTKIKNEILYNGSLEYKKVKENLLRIQREVDTVIKEILTIQTEFLKKKVFLKN